MFDKKLYDKKYYQNHRKEHDDTTRKWTLEHPDYQKEYYSEHREQEKKDSSDYQKKHLEKIQENLRNLFLKRRLKAFELLGNKCVRCGEIDWRCLQIDHIHGGGSKHFKQRQTWGIISDVINDPDRKAKYQLLCANCNWLKRFREKE